MAQPFSNLQQQAQGALRLLPGGSTPIQGALRASPPRKQDDGEIFGEVEGADKEPPYVDPVLNNNFNMPDPMSMPGGFASDHSPLLPIYPDVRSRNPKAVRKFYLLLRLRKPPKDPGGDLLKGNT